MAGLWYRAGTISVTNGSKKIVGSGSLFKTTTFKPDKGHAFYGPDGKVYEIDYVESDTVLYLVKAYTGATVSGQSYEIDITRTSTIPALSREISAQLAYAQGQYDSWQQILTGSGNVSLFAPDGQTISVPALTNMLSKSGNLAGLAAPDTALNNLGLTTVGKDVAKAANAAAGRTALGIGAQVSFDESAFSDFNDAALFPYQARAVKRRLSGFQPSNRPLAASNYWSMETMSVSTAASTMYWLQRAYDLISGRLFQRVVSTADSGSTRTYGTWYELWSTQNLPYETGTLTPSAYGLTTAGTFTATTRVGKYTRIGDTVFVFIRITGTISGAAGTLAIGPLPFAVANDALSPPAAITATGIISGSGKTLVATAQNAGSSMALYGLDQATGAGAGISAAVAGTFTIQIACSYKI